MDFETILYQKEDRIGLISINRPSSFNALNRQLIIEMNQLMDEINGDDNIGALIITGQGKSFAAGGDITELKKIKSSADAHAYSTMTFELLNKIEFLDKPVIAAVNGLALGGGCEIALACDIRIAADNAVFGLPEIKIGVIPGGGGTQRLPRLIGIGRAKELIFTGDPIDAHEAYRIGLTNKVVPLEGLMEEAKKMAGTFIKRPGFALKMAKTAVNEGINMDIRAALAYEMRCFEMLFSTDDQKEGMAAFIEKREAVFSGK